MRRGHRSQLLPASPSAWRRWEAQERARDTQGALNADHIVLFGGPRRLIDMAHALASRRQPPPDRLVCNLDDYLAAGMPCPVTKLAVMPPTDAREALATGYRHRFVILEPSRACPRGVVRVA